MLDRWLEHAGAVQFGACTTVHCSLEGFQAIDLPFGLAIAPALRQRIPDGIDIVRQSADELLHCVNTGLVCVIKPDGEPPNVSASKNASEPHGKQTHCGEVGPRADGVGP